MTGPLVTFIVFAYNQERYIRAAVEGALSQTYSPMQIVLSDDCSRDSTPAIMAELAAQYRGPHSVRFVRNPTNLGIVPHVFTRCCEATGEIIVVAAGDDISLPTRVETLVEMFRGDPKAMAVTSAYDLIDEEGRLLQANCSATVLGEAARVKATYLTGVAIENYLEIQGSTAAYRRSLFDTALPETKLLFSEDNLLNFLAYLYGGRVIQSPLSLVRYRRHSAAVGNRPPPQDLETQEREALAAAEVRKNKMLTYRWIAENNPHARELDEAAVDEEIRTAEIMLGWPEKSVPERMLALAGELTRHGGAMAKWQAGRLFGTFPNYQPKGLLARR